MLWEFEDDDLAAIANAMGVRSERVDSSERIEPALREALSADGPVLLDVATDEAVIPPPHRGRCFYAS
jgi:thiamine pyrophosphate-dependent acetolactate synthase large subunit-like protein